MAETINEKVITKSFAMVKDELIASNAIAAEKKKRVDKKQNDKEIQRLKKIEKELVKSGEEEKETGDKIASLEKKMGKLDGRSKDAKVVKEEIQRLGEVLVIQKSGTESLDLEKQQIAEDQAERLKTNEHRTAERMSLDEDKAALAALKTSIENGVGLATDNKEYNKEALRIADEEFKLRAKGATSKAATEEIEKERRALMMKQGTFLQKIAAGIGGISAGMKDKALAVGKGLMPILKGTLFAGLIFAFAKFLQTPAFASMVKYIKKLVKKLGKFYDDFFGPNGSFGKGMSTLFDDKGGLGGIVLGITGVVAALAVYKVATLFKKIKNGVGKLGSFLSSVGGKLKDMVLPNKKPSTPAMPGTNKSNLVGSKPSMTSNKRGGGITKVAKGIQTMGVAAGKGIGGFIGGILKGIASGLAAIANPLVLVGLLAVVAAINGIALAIRIMEPAFKPIGAMMKSFGESIREVFGGLGDFVKDIGATIEGIITSLGKSIGDVIDKISSMSTAGTEATTKQIKSLSDIPADKLHAAAKGIDAMKKALNDFGGGTFSKVADSLFGGNGPIDKLVALTEKVPALMKAAEAISVISAAGGDYAMAQQELKRREKVAELESNIAGGTKYGRYNEDDIAADKAELDALKSQKMELKLSGNRERGDSNKVGEEHQTNMREDDAIKMARGGRVKAGMLYTINEKGVETFVPDQPGQIINASKTKQIMDSGSMNKGSSQPIIVNAPQTQNAAVSNNSTTVTSTSIVEPDPMFRRNTQFAI